jgi:hypothetical protein
MGRRELALLPWVGAAGAPEALAAKVRGRWKFEIPQAIVVRPLMLPYWHRHMSPRIAVYLALL